MGQQQLLLIVLGVIIVGVAIVAGIGLFNAGAEDAAKDEINVSVSSNWLKCTAMVQKTDCYGWRRRLF